MSAKANTVAVYVRPWSSSSASISAISDAKCLFVRESERHLAPARASSLASEASWAKASANVLRRLSSVCAWSLSVSVRQRSERAWSSSAPRAAGSTSVR